MYLDGDVRPEIAILADACNYDQPVAFHQGFKVLERLARSIPCGVTLIPGVTMAPWLYAELAILDREGLVHA
ncbi:hypothetical protein EYZ11_001059 [Aspergillus tanneri]|uniref:Uncharacterized protein n=1 Tax=Aspergillus tanneri TaxID=1220188 RepID=A0A4S3JVH1_9EURO|nr:hypothetical protein EYZ11_001059 [Aspergillus tanneri]